MRAIVVRAFGGPEVLVLETVPVPEPGPGELLVEVVAAGVNPVDVTNCEDGEWAGIELPYTPGSDVSGVVRAVGAGVDRFAPGDEVFALTDFLGVRHGSYAELQLVPAELAVPKPASLSHEQAASVPLAAGTAYEAVVRRLAMAAGERVLVFGARGGVGGFAMQLVRLAGAEAIPVGRDTAIEDLPAGVDAVLDLVGGETVATSLPLVRAGGRVATIAGLGGDLDQLLDGNLTLHGVLVRPDGTRLAELARLLEQGALETTIRGVYPLERADDAHREVLRGGTPGKTVLRVRERGRAAP
jgi:NADPH2:quinone reductase